MCTREIVDRKGRSFLFSEYDGLGFWETVAKKIAPQGLEAKFKEIQILAIREDDVFVCTYPKTGTHWICEIVSMVLKGAAEYDQNKKQVYMIDIQPSDHVDALPSPRILNTHFPINSLPQQMAKQKTKIVHFIRNPKDIAVSFYYYLKNQSWVYGEEPPFVTFSEFLPYITGEYGVYFYGSLFRYFKEMETFSKENPDRVINIHYEDMKKNPVHEVQKIARFLRKGLPEDTVTEIVEKCSFDKLKHFEETTKKNTDVLDSQLTETELEMRRKHGPEQMYRKGEVGDWKNHFTVAENEQFDKLLEDQFIDSNVTFIYNI